MSVTAAAGFQAAGVAAGIKAGGARDVAVVVGVEGTIGAAVFTTSNAAAPPVALSRAHLEAGPNTRAVILNSGCANAGTGVIGAFVAKATAGWTAEALACPIEEVLVCSTGPIGTHLEPTSMERGVNRGLAGLAGSDRAARDAASAILTTDSVHKEAIATGGGFSVGGMAKGAGMVRPDMATMLAVITTDAAVDPVEMDGALREAVDGSFHGLNIDGCLSTNDTVIVMASGASGRLVSGDELAGPLTHVCRSLTLQMAADAEGASRVVRLLVTGAASAGDARRLGRSIADSVLVRSSFYGGDPNWGRILGALGAAPVVVDPSSVAVAYEGVLVAAEGLGRPHDEAALAARLHSDFTVQVVVGDGPGTYEVITTDLTPDYVRFNGERT